MSAVVDGQIVSPGEANAELARILASPDFSSSRQLTSFLRFVVAETLAGRSGNLKERTVAHGALGREIRFDPRLDCVVRVVAGKLRRSLEHYYALDGVADPVCIEVPKGTYCPVFRRMHDHQPAKLHGSAATGRDAPDSTCLPRRIIAVVPFRLFTDGGAERLLANILTDDVVVRLGRLGGVEVIDCLATGSSRTLHEDLRKSAARLQAEFILGGTVSRVGCCVRLTVRLIEGHSGALAWGDQYDREGDAGPLAQQDDIADRIVAGIRPCLGLL
jgi:TolB-like protein